MSGIPYLALALAMLIGVSLGALGSGGSIVTLPILVYVAGVPPKAAIGMSMAIVGATSAFGAVLHGRRGNFHCKAFLWLGLSGIAGAYLGAGFTHLVPAPWLMLLFAGIMLAVGGLMLRRRFQSRSRGECRPLRCLAIGSAVGVLTGFLGVGGGFLIVPALVLFAGLETRKSIGASLAIIAFNSFAGLASQLRYVQIDWFVTGLFTGLAIAGMWLGLSIANRISEPALRRTFAWALLAVAVVIGGINCSVLL